MNDIDLIKLDEKSCEDNDWKKCRTIYGIKHLYIIFPKMNGYIKDYDGSKHLTLVLANEERINLIKKFGIKLAF